MRVVAVRRADDSSRTSDERWVVEPGPGTEIQAGDVLLAKGTRGGTEKLRGLAAYSR
jgi:uncharacterized protein with PhoU and TrkA domain